MLFKINHGNFTKIPVQTKFESQWYIYEILKYYISDKVFSITLAGKKNWA